MKFLDKTIVVGAASALVVAALARADVITTGGLQRVVHDGTLSGGGTILSPLSAVGTLSGLTAGKVPVATSATALGNSDISDNTGVGQIVVNGGSTQPQLEVIASSGTAMLKLDNASGFGELTADGASTTLIAQSGKNLILNAAGATQLTIDGSTGAATFAGAATITGTTNANGALTVAGATTFTGTSASFGSSSTTVHVTDKDTSQRPTLSSCGTSPSVVGNDESGVVTVGTGGASSCVLTFHTAYSSNVSCVVTFRGGSLTSYAVTTTTLTMTAAEGAGTKLDYECRDH